MCCDIKGLKTNLDEGSRHGTLQLCGKVSQAYDHAEMGRREEDRIGNLFNMVHEAGKPLAPAADLSQSKAEGCADSGPHAKLLGDASLCVHMPSFA